MDSIIAVAGLGTHAFGTFRAPEGTQMWLRDFLKRDIPNIRVLLYGYESSVDNSDSVQTIKDLAITCLNIIHKFRARTEASFPKLRLLVVSDTYNSPDSKPSNYLSWTKLRWSHYSRSGFLHPYSPSIKVTFSQY